MVKKTTNHALARDEEELESPVLEKLAVINGSFAEGIDRTGVRWLKSLCTLQEETVRFVNHRLERDTEVIKQYQQCKNIIEMIATQQKWLAGLSQDYLQEGLQIGKVMQDIITNSVAEFTSWNKGSIHRDVRKVNQQLGVRIVKDGAVFRIAAWGHLVKREAVLKTLGANVSFPIQPKDQVSSHGKEN